MAIEKVNNLGGVFICSVVKTYTDTRELDVYSPKLIPTLTDIQPIVSTITNCSNEEINIKYNKQIKYGSVIRARASNRDTKLPKEGSKVFIYFFESDPTMCFWDKFNPIGDYEVIDSEKYDFLYTIDVGGVSEDISESDNVRVLLPEGYSSTIVRKGKDVTISIMGDESVYNRLADLETKIAELESKFR